MKEIHLPTADEAETRLAAEVGGPQILAGSPAGTRVELNPLEAMGTPLPKPGKPPQPREEERSDVDVEDKSAAQEYRIVLTCHLGRDDS
ncbi:MAG: hypothetical protein ACE5HD_05795 [Acidobacteriota bacterium]